MTEPSEALIDSTLLFRFCIPCLHMRQKWKVGSGITLGEKYRLPCFAELEPAVRQSRTGSMGTGSIGTDSRGTGLLGEVRMGWNRNGLFFSLEVSDKKKTPRRDSMTWDQSDGITLCIATRETHNVHRATRFCHQFQFMPTGTAFSAKARCVPIPGAKEEPASYDAALLEVHSELLSDGYLLQGAIPAEVLTGFDPDEHPRLGFSYLIRDHERGDQPLAVGSSVPVLRDPGFWSTLELR